MVWEDLGLHAPYSHFLKSMVDRITKGPCPFRRFDIDNTGYIRREDLLKILESETEVAQVMKELDVNGDGKISYEEFIGCLEWNSVIFL